jgi:hypothetical protein
MEKIINVALIFVKWQLFWEKEKMVKRQLLWDGGSIYQVLLTHFLQKKSIINTYIKGKRAASCVVKSF